MYRMTWDLLGANPTPMPPTELYTSLQQNVVDGQENPLETIDNSKWYEVQKFAIDTRHTVGAMTWIFSEPYLKSLPAETQLVLKEEGEKAMLDASQRVADLEGTLRKKFEGAGMTFLQPDLAPFRARLQPMLKEFPDLAPWVAKFQAVK
jgi:TRAP-type C4-dicarboxylate transport system substrate-binding protein